MNYVDSLNLFGVKAKEIPCVKFSGPPTESTEGVVGLLYMDTDTGEIYKCTAVTDGIYTWKNDKSDVLTLANEYSDKKVDELVESGAAGGMERQSITWDGNTEGLTSVTIELMGLTLYRVSDKLIPPGEAKMTMAKGNTIPGAPTEAIPGFIILTELLVFSAKAGEYDLGLGTPLVVPESGTYFAKAGDVYATSVSYEAARPIDQKYLPETVITKDNLTSNLPEGGVGYTDHKVLYHCDDPNLFITDDDGYTQLMINPTPIELVLGKTYTITTDSGEFTVACKFMEGVGLKYLGNSGKLGLGDNTGESFIIVVGFDDDNDGKDEMLFIDFNGGTSCIISEDTIHPINMKYLPRDGFGYTEKKIIHYDGSIENKETITYPIGDDDYNTLVKISDSPISLASGVENAINSSGSVFTDFFMSIKPGLHHTIAVNGANIVLMISVISEDFANLHGWTVGTYINIDIRTIVFNEVIHPIDQKYLPETVITKDNLTSNLPDNLITEDNLIDNLPTTIPNIQTAEVGQTIVVKAVNENGKPTEWETVDLPNEDEIVSMTNEYTDSQRIAYVEDAKTVFEIELIDDSEFPNTTTGNDYAASAPWLEPGKTYTVITDSGTFKAVCRELDGGMILGNTAILGGEEDTGETFVCFNFYETVGDINGWDTICADANKGTHMKIIADGTIHTIDPKYLPEAVITKDNLVTNLPEGGFGYTETERDVIFPETTFSTSSENSVPEFDIGYSLGLVEGKNYTIYYDGTSYDRTAYSTQFEGFGTIIVVGNDDDPASFMEPSGMSTIIVGERGSHTYALHGEVEVVNPIEPKFLPGVCLPVVELTTVPASRDAENPNNLTADENAMMNEVAKTNMPFILKYSDTSDNVTIILQVIDSNGAKMAYSVSDIVPVIMFGVNGEWSIRYQQG